MRCGNFLVPSFAFICMMLFLSACHPVDQTRFQLLLAKAERGDVEAQIEAAEKLSCAGAGRCFFGPWAPACNTAESEKWLERASTGINAPDIGAKLTAEEIASIKQRIEAQKRNDDLGPAR